MKKKFKILIIIVLFTASILGYFFISNYMEYVRLKMTNPANESFQANIASAFQNNVEIDISKITGFEWDTMHYIPPYVDNEMMFEKVGLHWTDEENFRGYLFDRFIFSNPISSDRYYKLIFVKDRKVVADYTMDLAQVQFEAFQEPIMAQDSVFKVLNNKTLRKYDKNIIVSPNTNYPMFTESTEFAIYLTQDENILSARRKHIDEIQLFSEPIITQEDILEYNWKENKMFLKEDAKAWDKIKDLKVSLAGMAFVLVCNGERIYVGGFWRLISSLNSPSCPLIYYESINRGKPIEISYYVVKDDIRKDERIYNALKYLNKIK